MNTSLNTLTAKDIMTTEVLMAYEGWSIKRLSTFLIKHGISGAPVIASDHSLVGVVSASDIVGFESKSNKEKSKLIEDVYAEYVGTQYQEADINEMAQKADENCTVYQVMTNKVIKVDEDATLDEIANTMLENGIRRIFVTKHGIVAGVISTTNILQALVGQK